MKVVLGLDSWFPQVDGVTNTLVNIDKYLKDYAESIVVAPSYGKKLDKEGEDKYCKNVFHNKSIEAPLSGFRNSMPYSDKKLLAMLDGFKPDILHANSPFAISRCFYKYGKKHHIPVVYTFHTKFKDDILRLTHSRLITWCAMKFVMRNINRADYVWAVSNHASQTLREYGYKGNIRIMYNASDMKPDNIEGLSSDSECQILKDIPKGVPVFMFSGRIVKNKNIEFSIRVVALLKARRRDCRFVIVGRGEEENKLKKLCRKLGVEDKVIFAGYVLDRKILSQYYARADLFLMPSTFDTYGLVVAEAGACATPTLAPKYSSSAEIIEDGVSGYIEELDENKWADKIEEILDSPLRQTVAQTCKKMSVGWDERTKEILSAYKEVIKDFNGAKA
ncbi:MAG: glycosyltransferase [Candidatus Coproplasma sp.]